MYTKNTIDLSESLSESLNESLSESLSWSLLKKSVSGEDLTKLETSTTSVVSSGSLSAGSDDVTFLSNIQTSRSNTKHFNTSLVTPNDLSKSDK